MDGANNACVPVLLCIQHILRTRVPPSSDDRSLSDALEVHAPSWRQRTGRMAYQEPHDIAATAWWFRYTWKSHVTMLFFFGPPAGRCLNPFKHLISYNSITPESNILVTNVKEYKRNDRGVKKLLLINQILLVSNIGKVQRTVRKTCKLMLGCNEFRD